MPAERALRHVPILFLDAAGFTKLAGVEERRAALRVLQDVLTEQARFFMPFGDVWEKALYSKGVALSELGRSEEAIYAYDDLIRRFDGRTEPTREEKLGMALGAWALALQETGRPDAARISWDRLLAFVEERAPRLQLLLRPALTEKAETLEALGRAEAAEEVRERLRQLGEEE